MAADTTPPRFPADAPVQGRAPDPYRSDRHRRGYYLEYHDEHDRRLSPGTAIAIGLGGLALGALFFGGAHLLRPSAPRPPDDAEPRFRRDGSWDGRHAVAGKSVLVNRPRAELYAFWRDLKNLPRFMENVRDVSVDGRHSTWRIAAPAGQDVTLDVELVEERENERLAWRSTPRSQIETQGRVQFRDAPAGRGTYVSVEMDYVPPAGALGRAVAHLFRRAPQVQARHELKRFKMLMEAGEVATSANRRDAA